MGNNLPLQWTLQEMWSLKEVSTNSCESQEVMGRLSHGKQFTTALDFAKDMVLIDGFH